VEQRNSLKNFGEVRIGGVSPLPGGRGKENEEPIKLPPVRRGIRKSHRRRKIYREDGTSPCFVVAGGEEKKGT